MAIQTPSLELGAPLVQATVATATRFLAEPSLALCPCP